LGRTFDKSAIASIISDTSCRKYGFIKFKVEVDVNEAYDIIDAVVLKAKIKLRRTYNWLSNSYKRLLNPAISNEAFKKLKLRLIPILFRFLLIIWDNCCWRHLWEKNEFWRLIQVLDLVVKLFVLTKRRFTTRPFIHTPKRGGDGDEENPFYGQFI
jgi:hypothetical protein